MAYFRIGTGGSSSHTVRATANYHNRSDNPDIGELTTTLYIDGRVVFTKTTSGWRSEFTTNHDSGTQTIT